MLSRQAISGFHLPFIPCPNIYCLLSSLPFCGAPFFATVACQPSLQSRTRLRLRARPGLCRCAHPRSCRPMGEGGLPVRLCYWRKALFNKSTAVYRADGCFVWAALDRKDSAINLPGVFTSSNSYRCALYPDWTNRPRSRDVGHRFSKGGE